MRKKSAKKGRGRPREFNAEQALDAATRVFADKGYQAASLSNLTAAMGINRVSMYATFGNKEALFVKAMERFTQASGDHLESCLAAGSAHDAVEKLLREAVAKFTNLEGPGVCFLTQRAPDASERTRRFVERKRACVELGLQRRFDRAVQDGELPSTVDAGALARFYSVTVQGLALQAQHGGTREELLGVVAIAMGAWPRALA